MNINAPIFVIGSYRSGTSIFAWCMGQHPNIVNLPETNWLAKLTLYVDELFRLGSINGRFSHLGLLNTSKKDFASGIGKCIDEYIKSTNPILIDLTESDSKGKNSEFRRRRSDSDTKSRWIDATPENSHYIYGLARMFSGARFIHLLRNPADVTRSLMKFSRIGASDYGTEEAFKTWLRLVTASVRVEKAFGDRNVLRILYEDLIDKPKDTLKRCLQFVNEDYSQDCIKPLAQRINSSETDQDNIEVDVSGKQAQTALAFYKEIIESGQHAGVPDSAMLDLLANDYARRIENLHNPVYVVSRGARLRLNELRQWLYQKWARIKQ